MQFMSLVFAWRTKGVFILNEPWGLYEFVATVISLVGAVFVARPSVIFGDEETGDGGSKDTLGIVFALIAAVTSAGGACHSACPIASSSSCLSYSFLILNRKIQHTSPFGCWELHTKCPGLMCASLKRSPRWQCRSLRCISLGRKST